MLSTKRSAAEAVNDPSDMLDSPAIASALFRGPTGVDSPLGGSSRRGGNIIEGGDPRGSGVAGESRGSSVGVTCAWHIKHQPYHFRDGYAQ